jgi:DNA-binding IclR family transcriptional regulator
MIGMASNDLPLLLDKALTLLDAVIADDGRSAPGLIAAGAGLPQATAYRLIATFVARGYLIRHDRGRYLPGPRFVGHGRGLDPRQWMARLATPPLRALARRFGQVAHLGVLEGGMVTYLVKTGAGGGADFARQGMQLEAYCSGVGKVLLAHLPDAALEDYLASGPFVRLTENTIVDPEQLRAHLRQVRAQGFALDEAEISDDLRCVATPVFDVAGNVGAAISLSGPSAWLAGDRRRAAARAALAKTAGLIGDRLAGSLPSPCAGEAASLGAV